MTYIPVWSCGPSAVCACPGRVSCGRYDGLVPVCFMGSPRLVVRARSPPTLEPRLQSDLGRFPATLLRVWVRVLGTSQVALADDPAATVDVGARKPRSVLAALALRLGSDVPPDALVRLVWGEDAPRGAHGTLHSYLSGVRRVLEPGLGPREKPRVLLTSDHGYRLALGREHVDAHRFADEVRTLHRSLAPLAAQLTTGPSADWPTRAEISRGVDRIEELLALWTGDAYADLPDEPEVVLERTSLDQLRLDAEEARVLGLLALGDHAVVVAATEEATARYPLRERVWALHALALTRSGRQAEALAALRQIRSVLADELGLDPGHELRDLEQAVLVQDPALHQWLRASSTAVRARLRGSRPPRPATSPSGTTTGWPTVGREAEEAALLDVLARAEAGTPATALLVGEPGIGKSRLVAKVMAAARERGFRVATGRCSQDDGAPSLWPWSQALRELAERRARHPRRGAADRRSVGHRRGRRARGVPRPARPWRTRSPPGRRPGRSCWCSTTCTGPTPRPSRCCDTSSRAPHPGTAWRSSSRGGGCPSRPATWPRSARSWRATT